MHRKKVLPGVCLLVVMSVFGAQAAVKVSINRCTLLAGEVSRIKLQIKGNAQAVVSWQQCDAAFKQLPQIIVLNIASNVSNGRYDHEVVFTCAQALRIKVKPFTIVIDSEQYLVSLPDIVYRTEKIRASSTSLMPLTPVSVIAPIKSFGFFALAVALLTTLVLLVINRAKKLLAERAAHRKFKILSDELLRVENAVENNTITADQLGKQVTFLLLRYLDIDISNLPVNQDVSYAQWHMRLHLILQKIKFSPPYLSAPFEGAFIRDTRMLLHDYQLSSTK